MRFLFLTQYFPPEVGAPQVRLFAVAQELQRRGHRVDVVTAMPNYPTGQVFAGYRGRWMVREALDGLSVVRTWIYPATGTNVLKRLLSYWSFTFSALFGCFRVPRPDYLFIESPPIFLGATAYLVSRFRRVPYILNVSDLWPASAKELGIVRNRLLIWMAERLERFLYRHARMVCAVTEGICDAIAESVGGTVKPVFLPNGVDLAVFRRVTTPNHDWVAPGQTAFTYAGTHGYAQGLEVILEVARDLKRRSDIVFLLVGDGPDKARLQEIARSSELTNVRFVGSQPVSAMAALFSASRASIVPLRRIPLFTSARPSKIFSSLACETPVIYSGEGDAAALIEQYRCGITVPPECPERLASAVTQLADNPSLARELGRNGRALTEAAYSWPSIVGRWLATLGSSPP